MIYNVIRWPDAQGKWWLVAETGANNSYSPLLELNPKWERDRTMRPTFENQLWMAAELLVEKGIEAVHNPHAMIGKDCRCDECFCCAARKVWNLARAVETLQESA